ncbi:MAG: type II toxin-antitoxin system HicA family toxin [Candidatus Omnitrophica bacterium]|nr:type II toxin-antitoxin system HicA family toxin [Candidatus Omnitrophota bacterium]MBU4590492.1 type II toxin-antitoxin system HicA family toxin [Candidatus Omnitrophota bacterium]
MKIREIIKKIEKDGWYEVRQKGSHRQYKHPAKKGLVTIAIHSLNDDIGKGTLHSIMKQAQIKES